MNNQNQQLIPGGGKATLSEICQAARGLPRTDGNGQCLWLATESGNGQWIPTGAYPLSWDEFKNSKQSPEYLARAFLYNFERPADPAATAAARARQALNWFNTLDWSGAG